MLKKLTALALMLTLLLTLTACKKSENQSDDQSKKTKSVNVQKALELIDSGDIYGAYDVIFNLKDRTEEEQEFFERFAFVPVSQTKNEDGQIVYSEQYTYNDDGYLLSRNVSNLQNDAYTIGEIATYDQNNNLLTYNYTSSYGSTYSVVHTYDNDGNMLSSKYGEHITEEFTYHSNGQLATYTYKTPDDAGTLYRCKAEGGVYPSLRELSRR